MRIGIDLRTLSDGKTTGVEVYTTSLLNEIFKIDKANEYVLFSNSFKNTTDFALRFDYSNVTVKHYNFPNRLLNASLRFLSYPKIDKLVGGLDMFFAPRYLFSALSPKCKLIITTHDLSFVHRPDFSTWQRRLWHKIISDRSVAKKASYILADSQSTKNDIVNYFQTPEEKVKVVRLGLDHHLFNLNSDDGEERKFRDKRKLHRPFILYLGTIEPRKNILGILEAYEKIRKTTDDDLELVLVGRLGWLYEKVLKKISESVFKNDIKIVNNLKEPEKPHLYRMARLMIFPSFYEGFGLPPLEAMACGTPVIAAMNSSFPEVLGESCVYVNPHNSNQIVQALTVLLSDDEMYGQYSKKGAEQAKKFSWEKTAQETVDIFNQIRNTNINFLNNNHGAK